MCDRRARASRVSQHDGLGQRGFTLIEILVVAALTAVVMSGIIAVLMSAQRSQTSSVNQFEGTQSVVTALDMIARDLRSAGYGIDLDNGQPRIAYIDSTQVLICANLSPFPDTTAKPGAPLAYNPAGNPKPYPLSGTAWTPPMKYLTGAEIIRWTLDANNDGVVNASDAAASGATVADRTPSPSDLVLVRQVYGDSTGNVAGANGPTVDQVAAVVNPNGAGVTRMFQVFLGDTTTAWNWGGGPIPVAQLNNIKRIQVTLTATSGVAKNGQYSQTSMNTTVYMSRGAN
jgi:prepilin-type N-terminal cleavage/methylation domain-containing protein